MHELALFAGAGGGILGGHLLGWRTRCAVEFDPYARSVLLARQQDGMLPRFPIWDDMRTFDGHPWRGSIDIVTGGFPCQDISAAGKGAGITGSRSGLWSHMARIVGEVRPRYVWVENSPLLVGRGLAVVLGDLASLGYDARWGVVGADDAGAPHGRKRIWILAHSKLHRLPVGWRASDSREVWNHRVGVPGNDPSSCGVEAHEALANASCGRCGQPQGGQVQQQGRAEDVGSGEVPDADRQRKLQPEGRVSDERGRPCDCGEEVANTNRLHAQGQQSSSTDSERRPEPGQRPIGPCDHGLGWWATEPHVGGMAHGLATAVDLYGAHAAGNVGRVAHRIPKRADRIRCIGNGQVPASLVLAWRIMSQP